MSAANWMAETYENLSRMTFDPAECEACGGTGVEAVRCCAGLECGCMGRPVEFRACPNGCKTPEWWTDD